MVPIVSRSTVGKFKRTHSYDCAILNSVESLGANGQKRKVIRQPIFCKNCLKISEYVVTKILGQNKLLGLM